MTFFSSRQNLQPCWHCCSKKPRGAKPVQTDAVEKVKCYSPTLSMRPRTSSFVIWRGCDTSRLSAGTSIHTYTAWMRAQDCGQSLPLLQNVYCWKQRRPEVSCVIVEKVVWGHQRVKMTMREKASALNVGCLVVQGDEQDILNVMYNQK